MRAETVATAAVGAKGLGHRVIHGDQQHRGIETHSHAWVASPSVSPTPKVEPQQEDTISQW